MKTINKPYYRCDHCDKLYLSPGWCLKHEPVCKSNPDNYRPCFECEHLSKKQTTRSVDFGHGEQDETLELLHCGYHKKFIYPPAVHGKAIVLDLELNDPMPKKCKHKKGFFDFNKEWKSP